MEMSEAPQAHQKVARPPPAAVLTAPIMDKITREYGISTAAAPIMHLHVSSASPFGRMEERSAPTAAVVNAIKNNPFRGTLSSTGFMERSHVLSQPGAELQGAWQQSQPGNHSKRSNHMNSMNSQSQGGTFLDADPFLIPSAGSASTLGSNSGILPHPCESTVLPGRSGPAGPANPPSYPTRPAGLASRFSSTSNPVANFGEPSATGQGHTDISTRKDIVPGTPLTL